MSYPPSDGGSGGYPQPSSGRQGQPSAGYPYPGIYPPPCDQTAPRYPEYRAEPAGYPGQQPSYPGQQPSYPGQQPSYPGQAGGYQATGYPGQANAYPGQESVYPEQGSGYPGQAGAYPRQGSGYLGQGSGYPAQESGQPGQAGAYPGQGTGYPGQGSGYTGQGSGYPGQGSGYPGQGSGYPGQGSGYPGQGSGYPGQGSGYPGQGSAYPGQGGCPEQGNYPGQGSCPGQGSSYPSQVTGYPSPATSYPGEATGSPPEQQSEPPDVPALGQVSGRYSPGNSTAMTQMRGTIRDEPDFSPEEDATALRKAMKGFGTDEEAIIEVLCRRSNSQRQEIALQYKSGYGKDLLKDLRKELGGSFEDVMLALMMPPFEYLASQLKQAMSGIGTDEDCLFETLCTHTNEEIDGIKLTYEELYGESLEDSVRSESSDNFKKLLTAILQANRDESYDVDEEKAAMQAQALYNAGEDEAGTDEETFTLIVATQNPAQLHAIMSEYEQLSDKSLLDAIKSETSGDYRQALLAVIKSSLNRPAYFAERIHDTMKGAGTRDEDLIRLVVGRAEYDLANIKGEYLRRYGHTLEKDISSETSGDYKKALVMIVEGN